MKLLDRLWDWLRGRVTRRPKLSRRLQRRRLTIDPLEERRMLALTAVQVRDINVTGNADPAQLVNVGSTLFFTATTTNEGSELWKTDGTSSGTALVRDIFPGATSSTIENLTAVNNVVFFSANNGVSGVELWKSDGTSGGTSLVRDIRTGGSGAVPSFLTNVNGTLFFLAYDGTNGTELWKSDGTSAGTTLVSIQRSGSHIPYPRSLTNVNGTLFFMAADTNSGYELWKSDGTSSGTAIVADIRSSPASSYPRYLTNVNGTVFFKALTAVGDELWKSDGTSAGTVLVRDIRPGAASGSPRQLTSAAGLLFFTATTDTDGNELWRSDGSSSGTFVVKDLIPGVGSGFPTLPIEVNGTLFFTATDNESSGRVLWKTNGTSSGTVLVRDVSVYEYRLVNVNGTVFFGASDVGSTGDELWRSDGTSSGTVLVRNINSSGPSNPTRLTNVNGVLYFVASDGASGNELWRTVDQITPNASIALSGATVVENGGVVTVRISLDEITTQTVTVALGFGGTAAFGVDYTASQTSIAIPAGQTSGSVTLTSLNDFTFEGNESIVVDITAVTNGTENGTQRVTASIVDDDPSGLPRVEKIVFAASGVSGPDVWVMNTDGSNRVNLTNAVGDDTDPVWSPDGNRIAFQTKQFSGGTGRKLYTMNPDGSNLTYVTDVFADDSDVDWSPDGSKLIFGNNNIYVVNADGSGFASLTSTNDAYYPAWSPDGTKIAFARNNLSGGRFGIYVMDANGTNQIPVYVGAGDSLSPAWSPDGTKIAFVSNQDSGSTFDIYLVNSDGSTGGGARLTTDTTNDLDPVWSPDGLKIAFTASRDGNREIYVMNADGSSQTRITNVVGNDEQADWGATSFGVPLVNFSSALGTIAESNGASSVTVTISASSSQTVTVALGFTGSAAFGVDYTASQTSIDIPAGQTSGSITLTSLNDFTFEGNESIVVDITGVTNGTENGTQQVTATIVDDEAQPNVSLSVLNSPLAENGGIATVRATLSNPSVQSVTITLGLSGTAAAGVDYSASGLTLSIPAGSTSGSITLTGLNDSVIEGIEAIVVDILTVTNGTENDVQNVTASITDDDPQPNVTLSLSGSPLAENNGTATVRATLSNASTQNVTINLGITGTATNNSDFSASSNAIVILAGQTSGSIFLTALDDFLLEGSESIVVDVTSVTNGTENGTQSVTATITDDDTQPSVTLSLSGSPLAENNGTATVRATLSNTSTQNITINLAIAGTATNNSDFSASSNAIVILAGQTSGSILLTTLDDFLLEGSESIVVDVTSVTNGTENGTQQVTATITDDSSDPFQLVGNALALIGTSGNDLMIIDYGNSSTQFTATVNGKSGVFTASTITVNAAGGADSLDLTLSSLADTATLGGFSGSVVSSNYSISFSNVETAVLRGSAADLATFNDPSVISRFTFLPTHAIMDSTAAGFIDTVIGFGGYIGNGQGNNDSMSLYGNTNGQSLTASPAQVSMSVGTLSLVGNNMRNYYSYGQGGTDSAIYNGSSTVEVLTATPAYSVVSSAQTLQYFVGFKNLTANSGGGLDSAKMYDSVGNDTFTSSTTTASFTGTTFNYRANGYSGVYAYRSRGTDTATLTGTAGDDRVSSVPASLGVLPYVILSSASGSFIQQAFNFSTVVVNAGTGNDLATLNDSTGNDTLNASGSLAELIYSSGHRVQLNGFDTVTARGINGGVNRKNVTSTLAYVLNFAGTWV